MFQASDGPDVAPPTAADMALIGSHDTPTFAGWLKGNDIADRVRYGLLAEAGVPAVTEERALRPPVAGAAHLGSTVEDPRAFLSALLEWLGRSDSPLVVPWLEDLWLEEVAVNLPGHPVIRRALTGSARCGACSTKSSPTPRWTDCYAASRAPGGQAISESLRWMTAPSA